MSKILELSFQMDIPWRILGAGTNILAPDEGLDLLVIVLKESFSAMEQTGEHTLLFSAGATMTRAAMFAASKGLSGLEFAHGIPGTVGGGVYMNAGAYGGEIKDVCARVKVMDQNGVVRWLEREELDFSYRRSAIAESGCIVLAAQFVLEAAPEDRIREKMRELAAKRRASQPLDLPSAGSAFKRPVGGYAAALIDQAGLKGYCVGGAAISKKHAGFAVNLGNATAADVKELLSRVSDLVYENSGIRLEPEVRIW